MTNGFFQSGLKMNLAIAQNDKWTLAELKNRNADLMKQALQIWPSPTNSYMPKTQEFISISLDDDFDLTGKRISRFEYKNTEQQVTSWADMFIAVMRLLHAEDKTILSRLAFTSDKDVELAQYVSDSETGVREASEVESGIYVERNTSTSHKLNILRKFFKVYGIDPSELIFYLRDDKESDEKEEAKRYEIRRNFWTFALPIINKAHAETGCFTRVNSTKMNWVNGALGLSNIHLTVVANQDQARVEFNFERSREENKNIFDKLKMHEQEIEKNFGRHLFWDRGDDKKASKIYYVLEEVNVMNQSDWLRMANFMAEKSRIMYDTVMPILKRILP